MLHIKMREEIGLEPGIFNGPGFCCQQQDLQE